MNRRPRLTRAHRALIVAVAALLFLGPAAAVVAQTSGGGQPLGGYKLNARAQAISVMHDSPDFPAPSHPDFDGGLPYTETIIDTGPIGHGLSAIFWPGPLGGNFGSALKQLSQFCAPPLPVPGLPPVCVPIPQQLKDNGDMFNNPIRAETFYPQAPQSAKYENIPGATMTSNITPDGKKVDAFGQLDGFGAEGLGVISQLKSTSTSTLTDSNGVVEATSEVSGVVLNGGLVTIGRVVSTAKLSTDGQQATGEGGTKIEGLKIAGQEATVDDQGLHLAGQTNPLHTQLNQALAQALTQAGLKIVLVPSGKTGDGATGSFTAGALIIQYEDANNQLAPGSVHHSFTIGLGGAVAGVDSSAGVSADLTETPVESSTETPPTDNTVAGTDIAPAGLGDIATPPSSFSTPRSPRARAGALPSRLISVNNFGLAWGLILLAIIAAMGAAFGLRRLTDDVFAAAPASAACPLEEPPK